MGGRSAAGRKLRRLGFDFLVDESYGVWLLEVNFLKNGYATGHAQKGPAGDAKREFVKQLVADETQVRIAVSSQREHDIPTTFEQLLPVCTALQENQTIYIGHFADALQHEK